MSEIWNKERAWEWYNSRPWIRRFNYVASGAVNRIEQWQAFEHDRIEEDFRREMKLAHETGFNAVRSILPFEVWCREHDTFMQFLENYIAICAENEIGVMLCFGNDCCAPAPEYRLHLFADRYRQRDGAGRTPRSRVVGHNQLSRLPQLRKLGDVYRRAEARLRASVVLHRMAEP